jgi:hypothetical protein
MILQVGRAYIDLKDVSVIWKPVWIERDRKDRMVQAYRVFINMRSTYYQEKGSLTFYEQFDDEGEADLYVEKAVEMWRKTVLRVDEGETAHRKPGFDELPPVQVVPPSR